LPPARCEKKALFRPGVPKMGGVKNVGGAKKGRTKKRKDTPNQAKGKGQTSREKLQRKMCAGGKKNNGSG